MGNLWTLVDRQRFRPSRCIFSLMVVFTIAALGCTEADVDLADGTSAARDTALPVGFIKPGATRSPVLRPTRDPSSIRNRSAPDSSNPVEAVGPGSMPMPASTGLTVNLTILAPTQGAELEVGAVRILGVTRGGTQVTVNGIPTEVSPDGSFTRDLILGEGINSVDAIARDASGQEVSETLVLLFVPRTEGVPLSILFPQGLEVNDPNLTIMGASRPDAVVGVNGVPVDINNLGIFSIEVVLEEGTNLIEIVAVDLDENVNFQSVIVFYIP